MEFLTQTFLSLTHSLVSFRSFIISARQNVESVDFTTQ